MPAVARGGSRGKAKPVARRPSGPRAEQEGFLLDAGKLLAARGLGLTPRAALMLAGGLAAAGLLVVLTVGGVGQVAAANLGRFVSDQAAPLGFSVKEVLIQGASPFAVEDIRRAGGITPGAPILGLDLAQVRKDVSQVGWVKDVRVVRLLPGTIVLGVVEHQRLAVWQHGGVSRVVDETGRVIPEADAARFADLPLIVGSGAPSEAAAMLAEIDRRPRLKSRFLALVRVDQRRWDIHLKSGMIIRLPADGEQDALTRLDRYDARAQVLDMDLARIDLLDAAMTLFRRAPDTPGPVSAELVANGI